MYLNKCKRVGKNLYGPSWPRCYLGTDKRVNSWQNIVRSITPLTSGLLYLSPPSTCRITWLNQSHRELKASKSMCVRRFYAKINVIEADPLLSFFDLEESGWICCSIHSDTPVASEVHNGVNKVSPTICCTPQTSSL